MSQDPKSMLQSSGKDFTPTIHHDTYSFVDPEQFHLNGLAVLITGASKGIGRATALSFAKAGATHIALGARSSLSDLETEIQKAAKDAGKQAPKTLSLKLDVTDAQSVEAAANEVSNVFGKLDILINNAGYLEPFVAIAESKVEDWWKVWEVNLKGTYLCTRAFLPLMLRGGEKTILNTSSVGAHMTAPGASGYQTGKLAVCRFSEFINRDYGDQGMLSYSIHPGGVATELALGMPEWSHQYLDDTAELAADSIVWLVSERREWLAGRYVAVNWDLEQFLGKKDKIVEGDLLKVRLDVGLE